MSPSHRHRPVEPLCRWILNLAIAVALAAPVPAQQRPRMPGGEDRTPLGGLGAEGDVVLNSRVGRAFEIKSVEDDGPAARGGMRVGDVVLSLNGKRLTGKGDPILLLERQIEIAEARKNRILAVVLLRDGKKTSLSLQVGAFGPHSKTCPRKCRKCDAIRKRAAKFLVQTQASTGAWTTKLGGNNGLVVVSTLGGLALHGTGRHRSAVQQAMKYVVRTCGAPSPFDRMRRQAGGANWSQVNWQLGYAPLFLTAFPQNSKVRAKLREVAAKLIENQEHTGGYAHGPGGPNALDYLELEIVSNYALASLGLMRDCGVALEEPGVDKGLGYIKACMSGDGGVAYSTRPGQAGHGDPGRTAGAYFAYYRHGLGRTKSAKKMLKFFERGIDRLPTGHVSPMMHILSGAMAARASGQTGLMRRFWSTYRPYLMSSRLHSGAFAARPTRESRVLKSNTDRTLGHAWTTATMLIVLNLMVDEKAYPHWFKEPKKRPKV